MNKLRILKNNIVNFKNYKKNKIFNQTPPSFIWIEPTNHCNLKCIMCPNGSGMVTIKKGYMDFDFFTSIIDQIKGYTSTVVLALNGESLLHPQFAEMVQYIKVNRVKVSLNTNATLLDEKMADVLLNSGLDFISFAFDGFTKSSYEAVRIGANYEKTIENMLYFLKLRKMRNIKSLYAIISILMLNVEEYTEAEKATFLKRFDGLIDEVRLREVSTWGSTFRKTDQFSYRKHSRLFPPCSRLWSSLCIAWNGDVLPCIYNANHEYVISNLKEESLKDAWNNEKMLSLRKAMIDGSYLRLSPLCDNCIILGTPPIMGIPAGIRISLADAMINFTGYRFEKQALKVANFLTSGAFSSRTIK